MRKFGMFLFFGDGELMVPEAIWLLCNVTSYGSADWWRRILTIEYAEKNGFSFS